jgi:hypothetical protein
MNIKLKNYEFSHYVILVSVTTSLSGPNFLSDAPGQGTVLHTSAEQNVKVREKRRHFGFALKTLP